MFATALTLAQVTFDRDYRLGPLPDGEQIADDVDSEATAAETRDKQRRDLVLVMRAHSELPMSFKTAATALHRAWRDVPASLWTDVAVELHKGGVIQLARHGDDGHVSEVWF